MKHNKQTNDYFSIRFLFECYESPPSDDSSQHIAQPERLQISSTKAELISDNVARNSALISCKSHILWAQRIDGFTVRSIDELKHSVKNYREFETIFLSRWIEWAANDKIKIILIPCRNFAPDEEIRALTDHTQQKLQISSEQEADEWYFEPTGASILLSKLKSRRWRRALLFFCWIINFFALQLGFSAFVANL